jgi:uncharacterized protein YfiM (DUF2279 family)
MDEFVRLAAVLVMFAAEPAAQPVPDIRWALTAPVVTQQQPVPVQVTDAWFGNDKFRHFWMSYGATAFTFAAVRGAGVDAETALWVSLPVAAVAGIGKEVLDRRRGGIFSVRDLVADGLGLAAAYFLLREVR